MIIRRYFILSLSALMLAGCAGDEVVNNSSSTDERLPLRLEATLSSNRPVTRAEGSKFETGDVLYSYVRHVYSTTDLASATSYELASQASLVQFEKGSDAMVVVNTSTNSTSNLTPGKALYWDDFSNASVSTENLRQDNHGLQSYYGYCYNGGTPTEALNTTTTPTGVLVWTTIADQSAKDAMKHNDLLWSPAQTPVVYDHGSSKESAHGTITVPYTHAMSKFTIVVEAKDGFKDGDLKNTIVTLKDVSKDGEFNAPEGKVAVTSSETVNVTMCPDGNKAATTRTYQAVTVPHTKLVAGSTLATITDAGGNNYEIKVTEKMLEAGNWGKGLTSGETQSGVNYQLKVTLKKQTISVSATLANWNTVEATGNGEIQFSADVTDCGIAGDTFNKDDAFSLWRTTDFDNFGDKATTCTYNNGVFENNPEIFWPDKSSSFYFRALAIKDGNTLVAKDDYAVKQNVDLLWATTTKHGDYEAGDAISPRTGDVPLTFKHALSNVIVTLETANGDAAVNLKNAKVTLANLNTEGTINIADAVITSNTPSDNAFTGFVDNEKHQVSTLMVPQDVDGKDMKLIVTIDDGTTNGTTYSLLLKNCKDEKGNYITKWEGGNKYVYTIHLEKEEMKFRAVIEEWKPTTGSGNATLDWDDEDENS